ncbi:DNA polymerase III subunit alpha [candidate division WOR-3 bacterium JGI_Cruoil_03_44_89]|uniref:DNA-directed DNA polymerase n=1 Tax=candidate division WOR-3 bacterium JGI_Cruoil_03_44_89 TaxID=1973748 RepID=A0A235BTL1_UNCW3|nr:MAG: DNA polymerase III subunit alpha [candidate division WOR-3 bacterium JGI_Cruoil_03_44_89]
MPHANFVHLHLHTEYSFLDGACKIDDLVEVASRYKLPALAITDHGNMCGCIEFYRKLMHAAIKPIIGEEVYLAPKSRFDRGGKETYYHLILLVRNDRGYKNLIKLSTIGYKEGFYYKPRIDKEVLREYGDGLIGMSACTRGEIAYHILRGNHEAAKGALLEYLDIFGKENFYLELMRLGLKENEIVNGGLLDLSEELGVPCVATNDCHYISEDDSEAHDILLCLQTGKDVDDKNRMRFGSNELYFRSPEEMEQLFSDHPEAVRNTLEVADRCNLDLHLDEIKVQLPHYDVPEGFLSNDEYLEKLAREGLEAKYVHIDEKIEKRFNHEFDVIKKRGLSGYFLIITDLVNFARKNNIPIGPGRGSAVGSLVLYALGVTEIDPLKYALVFERFLNPERAAMPDVDIDFSDTRREEVISYIKERYGEENVSQIITFGTMAARAAIRDVGRVLKISLPEVDRIAKAIPFGVGLKEAYEMPEFRAIIDERKEYEKLISLAMRLEGITRHASVHAAGIVVAPHEITEFVPLYRMPDGSLVTQYPMKAIDALGLLKIDILGLRTLTIINDTAELLRNENKEIDIENIPLDDKKTFNLLSKGMTNGVFQLESEGMKDILRKIKPDSFTDIMALLALYRPGPLGGLTKDSFIRRKHGKEAVDYIHESLERILKETYGIILYQEQVMQIAAVVSGFSLGEADILRRAMGKKLPEVMAEKKKAFVDGALQRKYSEETANRLFELIVPFAGYGFTKSHSAGYALISYRTAFLKAHYPQEFLSATLTNESSSSEKVAEFVKEVRALKIDIYFPDINKSFYEFLPEGSGIRFGLCAVKNVGENACMAVLSARKRGEFKTFLDFLNRVDSRTVNKRAIESLIKAGTFDEINEDREGLLSILRTIQRRQGRLGQASLFKVDSTSKGKEPFSSTERLSFEKDSLGFYLSGHPLDRYSDELAAFTTATSSSLAALPVGNEVVLSGVVTKRRRRRSKSGDPLVILALEDLEGVFDATVFGDDLIVQIPEKDSPVLVKGKIGLFRENKNIKVNKIISLSKVRKEFVRSVEVSLNLIGLTEETLKSLKAILEDSPGDKEVFLRMEENGKYTVARCKTLKISPRRATLSKIRKLLGEHSVILKGEI